MKTLTKQEAVAAFSRGEKVEYCKYEEWHAVKSYSMFDQDLSFRLADFDEDAEWLQTIIKDVYGGHHIYKAKFTKIADRLLSDKARIAELEASNAVLQTRLNAFIASEVARLKQDDNPWIPHDGGPMPCDGEMMVDYRLRSGVVYTTRASAPSWSHNLGSASIIAWRPAKGGDK